MNPDPMLSATPLPLDPGAGELVLIVDDLPDNLALLHDALDEAGCTVLVATDGASAIARATEARPDVVLLDALMPGMDGFEVARRLKANPATAAIPIVFMTALTETEHVVAAFGAGGVDYVTKPIQPREVLARIRAHTRTAREQRQARQALDAFGHASLVLRAGDGRLVWQTPLARSLLREHFGHEGAFAPVPLIDWLRRESAQLRAGQPATPLVWARGGRRLSFALHPMAEEGEATAPEAEADEAGEWLVVASEHDDAAVIEAMVQAFRVTAREAEVLYWVAKGKTNRDIGDILGASPRTITKHMEHILQKLGVETRTAAAGMVLGRLGRLLG
ncbi:MAG: response regulator [Burkholderiaceae bacterium]|nr:response regulator [Burkholderiaceae bacterium]